MSRGPLPTGTASRRNKPTIPTTNLPVSGYKGEFPPAPSYFSEALADLYEELWRSPMGAAWMDEDAPLVAEIVATREACKAVLQKGEFPPGTATGRVSAIEDKLGLSPKARAQLRWRIVDDPPDTGDPETDTGTSRFESFGEADA